MSVEAYVGLKGGCTAYKNKARLSLKCPGTEINKAGLGRFSELRNKTMDILREYRINGKKIM